MPVGGRSARLGWSAGRSIAALGFLLPIGAALTLALLARAPASGLLPLALLGLLAAAAAACVRRAAPQRLPARVGAWDWDVGRDALRWDPVMHRLHGLRAKEFPGTREAWERAVHREDRAFVVQELEAALRGWRPFQPRFRVVWPDGSVHHLQACGHTSHAADGAPLRMVGVLYAIDEQVRREQALEEQRRRLAATLAALVDPLLVLTLEERGPQRSAGQPRLRVAEINPAAAAFFCRSPSRLLGQPLERLLPESLNEALLASLHAAARGGPSFLADGQPVRLRQGAGPRHLDLRAVAVGHGLVLSFRDVSERRRIASTLADSEARFRLLAENVTDVVFLSEAGRITWMAPGITAALGWSRERWLGHGLTDFCHPADQALARHLGARVEAGEPAVYRLRLRDRGDHWHWVEVHAGPNRSADGRRRGSVAAFRVVDREVEAEAELDRRARRDPLTGLDNRQEILERLERLVCHRGQPSRRQGDGRVAVLFCDIDHFKAINDRNGHGGGDAVLRALAERLRHSTRRGDLLGRLGGDELLVVLPGVPSLEAATAIAEMVRLAVREPLRLATGSLSPSLSIGVTLIQAGEPVEAAVARADQALYAAKQGGRDRVVALAGGPPPPLLP